MKLPLLFTLVAVSTVAAYADDQTQAVQKSLKDQGFYYGQVDGQPGPETDAAIKRYQIRQGLDVSGKLDAQTLASLKMGGGSGGTSGDGNAVQAVPPAQENPSADAQAPSTGDAPDTTPLPRNVVQSDHDFLKRNNRPVPTPQDQDDSAGAPPVPPPRQGMQPPPPPPGADDEGPGAGPGPGPGVGQALPTDYADVFRKTPYETAPLVVQRSTFRRAQTRLAQQGFFHGIVDGQPGSGTSKALAAYQRYAQLRVTGRLDMDTLADMNLLPRREVIDRPPAPVVVPGRDVYRGIWVR